MRLVHALYAVAGLLYLAMPAMTWFLLHQRYAMRSLRWWCVGGLMLPVGIALQGMRSSLDDPTLGLYGAATVINLALALQLAALRIEARRPARLGWLLLAVGAGLSLIILAEQAVSTPLRRGLENVPPGLFTAAMAVVSVQLARTRHSRSAWLLAAIYACVALALLGRALQGMLAVPAGLPPGPETVFTLAMVLLLAALLATNLGYLGLALDWARDLEMGQRNALVALHQQQVGLEAAARGREMLANERARTTRLLAHEVRQPLHNASVSLQRALETLAHSDDPQQTSHAIEQAQEVIRNVSATLDNTVAAATLLAGAQQLRRLDSELPLLLDLCLGDLPPEARRRVRLDYRADARSAQLEPTLVRLALRNLLTNATLYSPRDTPVLLRVLDCDEPLALVIEVVDEGPGVPEALRERIFEEGTRGDQPTVPGHGLGLHVVKRVAQLHGGRIDYEAKEPRGSIFRLTLPQGAPD